MKNRRKIKFILSLISAGIVLCSCSSAACSDKPVYPVGGPKVAEELQNIPYQGYEDFWEWIGRVDKLRQELEI